MATVQTSTANVNGGEIYYEISGEGPSVVLVHGFGVDRRMWVDQLDALSERYTVIAYDLRGFGKSSMPSGTYRHSDDLAVLLGHVGVENVSLVGSSLGGRVALDFAIAHPERTRTVITEAGVPSGFDFTRPPGAPPGPNRALLRNTLEILSDEKAEFLKSMVADYSRWHRKNTDPRIEIEPPAIGRLGEIMAPVLVTVGSLDEPDFHRAANMLVSGIARSRTHIFEGSGHLPNMDAPEEFNRVVLDFLDLNRHYSLSR